FPMLKEVVPGRWLAKGTLLGVILSPERKVIAYARDNEVNKLLPGDPVVLQLRDSLEKYPGRVENINPVAVKFHDSTLVQQTGGFIPCFSDGKTKVFTPVNVLYAVQIKMDTPIQCPYGRTGIAEVKKKYVLALEISRTLLHVFFREFSF
ncbi:MAG: HlyD family efflux transporter periplasmic adaptor subunit, partial [Lentisphaeria bacterium]|nr:HlyD family efflux transporter periplasmic adaptor subunit [Lentisphaeria bacterium]